MNRYGCEKAYAAEKVKKWKPRFIDKMIAYF